MDLTLMMPTPAKLNQIYHELGTSEDQIKADVQIVAEWMRKQPHFRGIEVDERRIRMYLLLRKNSLERTKETLDQYYTIKFMVPEIFGNKDPTSKALEQSMDTGLFIPLPKLTEEGYRVSLSRLRIPEVNKYKSIDNLKVSFMTIDIRMLKLDTFLKEIFIYDFAKYSMSHFTTILSDAKKMIYCVTTAYPLRIHQIHIINMPSFAQSVLNMVIGFLKKKIADRIIIHGSIDDLKKNINPDILPLDYGGTYPKTSEELSEDWKEELIKHSKWFLSQSLEVCDESKRIKKHNVNIDMLSGTEGSFRKLEVD